MTATLVLAPRTRDLAKEIQTALFGALLPALSLPVRDFFAAREATVRAAIDFDQFGPNCVLLRDYVGLGAKLELREGASS